jgi:hypothetical protein
MAELDRLRHGEPPPRAWLSLTAPDTANLRHARRDPGA